MTGPEPGLPDPQHASPWSRPRPVVEAKVIAGSAGASLGGLAAALIVGLLGDHVYDGPVPDYLAAFIAAAVPLALSYLAAFRAPHTRRPDLDMRAPAVDPVTH